MGKYFHFLVSLLTASLPLNGAFSPPNPINLNGNLDVPEESEISLRNEYFYRYQMDTVIILQIKYLKLHVQQVESVITM